MKAFKSIKQTLQQKRILIQWFSSYIIILAMAFLASIAIYFYSYNLIEKQQKKLNLFTLEKVREEIDHYFFIAKKEALSLTTDADVQKLADTAGDFSIKDRERIYTVYKKINEKKFMSEDFKNIFIYFLNSDSILAEQGHLSKKLFYELYYENENMSFDSFKYLIENSRNDNICNITSKNDEEICLFQKVITRNTRKDSAVVVISISKNTILKKLENINLNESSKLLILQGNDVIFGNDEIKLKFKELKTNENILNVKSIKLNNEKYYINIIDSKEKSHQYAILTNASQIESEANKIQLFTILSLSICLSIGLLIAYKLTNINYNPLKKIMNTLGDYTSYEEFQNEYEWIHSKTLDLTKGNKDLKEKLLQSNKMLHNQELYRLITLPYDNRIKKDKANYFKKFSDYPYNITTLLYSDFIDKCCKERQISRALLCFIISNILEEQSNEKIYIETVDLTDCLACILSLKIDPIKEREYIEEIFDKTFKFIKDMIGINFSIVFGSKSKGIEGIYSSYICARETLTYFNLESDTQMIWYDDIKNRHTLYKYSIEKEQKIINAICAGSITEAKTWINEVISKNYNQRELSYPMKKCLVCDITGTILKAAEKIGATEYLLEYIQAQTDTYLSDEVNTIRYFENLLLILEEKIKTLEKQKREDTNLGKQVMKYVNENFSNPDLNISITALHFGITPSYLSALFKEQTGQNLLEFINNTRIEHVKKLLEEGKTLNEISTESGFRSSGALIRVFKKTTGITPGQMKKVQGLN